MNHNILHTGHNMLSDNTEYDYEVENLGVHNELNGKKNVIYEIRLYITATKENITEEYGKALITKKTFFVVPIPTENIKNFIEYENITKSDIISWTEKYCNSIDNYKKSLEEQFYPKKQYLKPSFAN